MTDHAGAKIAYVASAGLLFALLQTGYFYQLQFWMTSDYPSYLVVTIAWLGGNALGLVLGKRTSPGAARVWCFAGLAAYYCVLGLLRLFPYRLEWLPVDGLLIAVSGLQAGHFFAINRSLFPTVSRLFFWENNGFLLGWLGGFAGYAWLGNQFEWVAPAITAVLYLSMLALTVPQPIRQRIDV